MTNYNHSNNPQKGFTLVELSIVLVIIGLIIASVLVGQDLVRSAELRSSISQYESFNTASATFKGKYSGLPGDVRGYTDYGWGPDATNSDGNGNGTLAASTALTGENVFFWLHLGSTGASLISGSYLGTTTGPTSATISSYLPAAKVGGYWGVYASGGINYYILGVAGGTAGVYLTTSTLTPLDAFSIDQKVDDGKPGRGIVQVRGSHATNADLGAVNTCASSVTSGAPDISSTYVTSTTSNVCTLRFRQQI